MIFRPLGVIVRSHLACNKPLTSPVVDDVMGSGKGNSMHEKQLRLRSCSGSTVAAALILAACLGKGAGSSQGYPGSAPSPQRPAQPVRADFSLPGCTIRSSRTHTLVSYLHHDPDYFGVEIDPTLDLELLGASQIARIGAFQMQCLSYVFSCTCDESYS